MPKDMEKKTYTGKEIKELLESIIDFIGGTDSEVEEYIRQLQEDY